MTEQTLSLTSEVEACFANSLALLTKDGVQAVQHYLQHGEPEMAFEGLLLELIAQEQAPVGFVLAEWIEIAKRAGLHDDAVFDVDVIEKLSRWAQRFA